MQRKVKNNFSVCIRKTAKRGSDFQVVYVGSKIFLLRITAALRLTIFDLLPEKEKGYKFHEPWELFRLLS